MNVRSSLAIALAVACTTASAGAVTTAELNGWFSSTSKIVRLKKPAYFSVAGTYIHVAGTELTGLVSPDYVNHGFLRNEQEVMVVPVNSGGSGGVFGTLLFTRLAKGKPTRFVGIIPSLSGHLDVTIAAGQLRVRTPIYKTGDPNCCPSGFHYELDTLHGTTLVKVESWDAKA